MARKSKVLEPTTQNNLGAFLTGETPKKVEKKVVPEVSSEVSSEVKPIVDILDNITLETLKQNGFYFEYLNGATKTNLCHKRRFLVNDISTTRGYGCWIRTFDSKDLDYILRQIKTVELVE